MDVLEGGPGQRRGPRRGLTIVAGLVAAALTVAVAVGAAQWWLAESDRPERLEITGLEVIGPFAIGGDDLPADWPRDLVVGAVRMRVAISGDPQRATRVNPVGDAGAYAADGVPGAVIPAGEASAVDVMITPANCGALDATPLAPVVDAQGAEVPMSAEVARALVVVLESLCEPGGTAPAISANSIRVDVFFRDRTLVMRARISSAGDRVILQPRDSAGFRGAGEQEATMEGGVATARLRWLISPAEVDSVEAPTVRVRAFAVIAGRAYPWVLDLRVPDGFSDATLR